MIKSLKDETLTWNEMVNFIERLKRLDRLSKIKDYFNADAEQNLLHYCCIKKKPLLLKPLLDIKIFNVNEKDVYGRTPLLEASVQGSLECVQALIDAGANVNLFNKY